VIAIAEGIMKQVFSSVFGVFLLFGPLASHADSHADIWQALKKGGLVVLMRHASVDNGNPLVRDPSCLKENNLSDQGKREAAMIGVMFADMGVPITNVLTSPYCRTIDTARIAFGGSQSAEFLSLPEVLPQAQAEANSEKLLKRIGSYFGRGNLILVTHAPNIGEVSSETVETGAFLVLKPKGGSDFEELGKIKLGTVKFSE